MSCCGSPKVTLKAHRTGSGVNRLTATFTWSDSNCRFGGTRRVRWEFYKDGVLVHALAYAAPTAAAPIGLNSTYTQLNTDPAEIEAYLADQGVEFEAGDMLTVKVRIRNCKNLRAVSNAVSFVATGTAANCDCTFVRGYTTGQTGTEAADPDDYEANGGVMVFRNGLANHAVNDFSEDPLEAADLLTFVTLDQDCPGAFGTMIVTGAVGTVPVPAGFTTLAETEYLVFRNGVLQSDFTLAGGNLTPVGAVSEAADTWFFVRLANGDGCMFGRELISNSASGSTVELPSGYTASNQSSWLLFVNGLLQDPNPSGAAAYTVSGSTVTFTTALVGDTVWIVPMS